MHSFVSQEHTLEHKHKHRYYTDMREANQTYATASTSTFSSGTIKAVVLILVDCIVDAFAFQTESMHLKYLLHVVEVVVVHCFVFFDTEHLPFTSNSTLIVFYLLWVVVHITTSLQIKNGYHTLQRMTLYTRHNYETFDKIVFIVYRALPFVNELDVILRWVTSDTAMDLAMHFRLNDILSTLFRAKCEAVRSIVEYSHVVTLTRIPYSREHHTRTPHSNTGTENQRRTLPVG